MRLFLGVVCIALLIAMSRWASAQPPLAPGAGPKGSTASTSSPGGSSAAQAKKQLQQYVQDALNQALLGLGADARQKKIFADEAMGDSQAFVTNYKTSGVGSDQHTDVEVDADKLGQYLRFDGALFGGSTGGMAPRVCVRVRPERGCAACERLASVLEDLVSKRLAKRGFTPVPGPQLVAESELTGESAFDEYTGRALEARCDGALYGEIQPQRSADTDDEDEDIRLQWNEYLAARDLTGHKIRARAQGAAAASKSDVEPSESYSEAQLLTSHATADLYAQAAGLAGSGAGASTLGTEAEEHYLKLGGVTSFAVYQKFKDLAPTAMPGLRLEERIIQPGEFSFALPESVSTEKLAQALKQVNWGGQTLQIVSTTASELEVILK